MEFRKLFRGSIGLFILAIVWANPAFSAPSGERGSKLNNTGVVAGSYVNANITVGADGRIYAASDGTPQQSGDSIFDMSGHIKYNGTAPTADCNCSAGVCNAPLKGTDSAGVITVNDSSPLCSLHFDQSYNVPPACVTSLNSLDNNGRVDVSVTNDGIDFYKTNGTLSPGTLIYYQCVSVE